MARALRIASLTALAAGLALVAAAVYLWNDRPDPAALDLPLATAAGEGVPGGVRVTWLGVTTLLFDDGETRILTDGFFSRPGVLEVLLDRPVAPDLAGIDAALVRFGISELAAVIPVHSHYDHAMDAGEVALRTGAVVLGSESTANVARGAGLPEDRIVALPGGGRRRFGRFEVRLVPSQHWPARADGSPPMPGEIAAPLTPPAPITAWREGGSYSVVIAHPSGVALLHGSAGFIEGALEGTAADVVLLGIGGLSQSGRAHAAAYWREVVSRSSARRVFPVHWDDFTRPYGEVMPFPRRLDDLELSLAWLHESAAAAAESVKLERLPFGRPVELFGSP